MASAAGHVSVEENPIFYRSVDDFKELSGTELRGVLDNTFAILTSSFDPSTLSELKMIVSKEAAVLSLPKETKKEQIEIRVIEEAIKTRSAFLEQRGLLESFHKSLARLCTFLAN